MTNQMFLIAYLTSSIISLAGALYITRMAIVYKKEFHTTNTGLLLPFIICIVVLVFDLLMAYMYYYLLHKT